jgi:hypothetical protein
MNRLERFFIYSHDEHDYLLKDFDATITFQNIDKDIKFKKARIKPFKTALGFASFQNKNKD